MTTAKIKESMFCSHQSFQLIPEQEPEVSTKDFSSPVFGSDHTCILEERCEYLKFEYMSWALPTPLKDKMFIDNYCIEFSDTVNDSSCTCSDNQLLGAIQQLIKTLTTYC